ncbi:indolepyruvate/phenylpyruvate decarboxylase [Suttonella sp. R2A3]|uniref:indolepyruvate/phenylpyruvate decarboxylase n=1 Tax=Suttonella sp. R2A3 TaxID=2908648 RepID=UPI001F474CA9|nr:indolepyruvate/phenylpyruvate decarboxylase [Suttonella sp. R2A3]UJF24220.1 indolepyruvate/phenylpyruvate decarboxylase [Suttonella sp. R2A3]
MTLAEVLLDALKARGVAEIFGIPGDFALPLFKAIEESQILPCYYLSHEPAVGFAADAAARMRCAPSVAAVTYGAGGFNMVNPIAAAYAEKSPVIVLSGGPGDTDKQTGLLVHHQAKDLNSQLAVYREVTCDQAILDDLSTAPQTIARVLDNCLRYSRPVYLEIPRDKVFQPCEAVPAPVDDLWPHQQAALDACADAVLSRLQNAEQPILVVGVEVRRFDLEAQVAELAKRLDIPVVTTLMGRGMLANDPDIALLGTYLGSGGDADLSARVEDADAMFLLGVILTDNNFGLSGQRVDFRRVMHAADGQCSMGYHIYPNIGLKPLLNALLERLPACDVPKKQRQLPSYPQGFVADDAVSTPTDVATLINDHFHRHEKMPLAADMGDCFFTTLDIESTELVAPGFYATMGYGIPAGLGLQAADGRRPIILVGDGAFQMTGWELLNAPRYGFNPIVLVFNNASWEMLRTFQPESAFNDLPRLDFAAIGESLGGKGHRAPTRAALANSFAEALADEAHFHIIDIQIEREILSNTLARFVAGFKKMREG